MLFIFAYNKLVIVFTGFTLFLLRNASVTKHYVTKYTSEWASEWASDWVNILVVSLTYLLLLLCACLCLFVFPTLTFKIRSLLTGCLALTVRLFWYSYHLFRRRQNCKIFSTPTTQDKLSNIECCYGQKYNVFNLYSHRLLLLAATANGEQRRNRITRSHFRQVFCNRLPWPSKEAIVLWKYSYSFVPQMIWNRKKISLRKPVRGNRIHVG